MLNDLVKEPNLTLTEKHQGKIRKRCIHPDVDHGKPCLNDCVGCTAAFECNEAVLQKLHKYEQINANPNELRNVVDNFQHIVTETCPVCEEEINIIWDVETKGYKTYCPVCGSRVMLCSECMEHGYCDWNGTNNCGTCHKCQHKPLYIDDLTGTLGQLLEEVVLPSNIREQVQNIYNWAVNQLDKKE